MRFKRLITIFICMFVMFLGIIPKGSFYVPDHTLQYGIGNTETISKPMAESREDAAVKEVTTITQSLNVVFTGVKRISATSKILPSNWIIWFIPILWITYGLPMMSPQSTHKFKYFIPNFTPFAGVNMQKYANICRKLITRKSWNRWKIRKVKHDKSTVRLLGQEISVKQ